MIRFDEEHKNKYGMVVDGEIVRDYYDEIILYSKDAPALFTGKRISCVGTCKNCSGPLFASSIPDYKYQCFDCDEDFYAFEQEVTNETD